jgi:eukaryotic-like serine/threonine-protein kinase
MSSTVTFTILEGSSQGTTYSFSDRRTIWVGRDPACDICFIEEYDTVSRRHCIIDINPPKVSIRDYDSKYGTHVDNRLIGKRQPTTPNSPPVVPVKPIECNLHSGNIIGLGETHLRLEIQGEQPNYDPPKPTSQLTQLFLMAATKAINLYKDWLEIPDKASLANTNVPSNSPTATTAIGGYKIIKPLGHGSYGEVFLAESDQGQQIAIKILLPDIAAAPDKVQKFEREIENAKALDHPNVVRLLGNGFDPHNQCLYYAMEYCAGDNLETLMNNMKGILPWDTARRLIGQILDGLAYTHSVEIPYVRLLDGSYQRGRGLVHRDLKPANIVIAYSNRGFVAKIGDFGLSKAYDLAGLSGHTMTDDQGGTKGFMCRKQFLDFQSSKPEVDIWAAAACLYYMLTHQLPRDFSGGDNVNELLTQDVIPIRDRNPEIPPLLAEVIDRALWEEPDKNKIQDQVLNYQQAQQFKIDLETAFSQINI